tara:strand:- start:19 stop:246 length:228 start_codon:yes stop_codon:yes gene_type:complete
MATKTIVTPEFPDGKVITLTSEEEAVLKAEQDADAPKVVERDQMVEDQKNLRASAKAKLVAGEALTEEEADTIVL